MLDGSSEGLRGGAASIAQELLETTTEVAAELLSAEAAQLAPPLCQVLSHPPAASLLPVTMWHPTPLPVLPGCCPYYKQAACGLQGCREPT